nr:hypothetical protein [Tanacetum cinerariifolium]
MPPKLNLVFNTTPTTVKTDHPAFTVQLSPIKPSQDLSHTNRTTAPTIEDWVSDSKDESETKSLLIVPSFVQSSEQVKSPRHSVQPVKTSILDATLTPASLKSASSVKRRNRKACFVCKSVDHLIKDCDYHAKKMAQPTPRNYAHRGVNTPRSDEDRLELMELTVFLLPTVEKVGIGVNAVDLQVFAVRHMLLLSRKNGDDGMGCLGMSFVEGMTVWRIK